MEFAFFVFAHVFKEFQAFFVVLARGKSNRRFDLRSVNRESSFLKVRSKVHNCSCSICFAEWFQGRQKSTLKLQLRLILREKK